MAYKALYRTYRPSTFDEVAGQQHIVKTLKNALATNKIAHAYLFAGPRGTGKTTMAKLLAKALNCEEGIGCQCNECKNCIAINDGSHPDVLEIDAASNNGVEQIRDIIDKVKYGTILGKKKVYIIDEVHMMTPQAFNALLKTLEEPPEHVVFILATTEPHKILPTILSRCQRYDFSRVSDEDITNRIKVVLEHENIPFDEEAIKLIVSLADGGMRDALSILDQVLAYSGNKLNVQDVLDIFALESTEEKISLIKSISAGNVNIVLEKLNSYIKRGTDINRLTNDLLLILKDVLIFETSSDSQYLQILTEEQAERLDSILPPKAVKEMITILINALKEFKNVPDITSFFEITLLNLASVKCEPVERVKPVIEPKAVENTHVVEQPKIENNPKFEEKFPEKPNISENSPIVEEEKIKSVEVEETVSIEPVKEIISEPIINDNLNLSSAPKIIQGIGGDSKFEIDQDMLIKIMVASKKDIKNNFTENWEKLKRFITHPVLGNAASLLYDSHLLVASNKAIIVVYQFSNTVDKMNDKNMQINLQNVCQATFGIQPFVYAVNRNDSVTLQKTYMELLQVGKLPKAANIEIKFEGEN